MACSEGGTSIEELAEKYPEKIVKIPMDIRVGITSTDAAQMVDGLKVTGDKKAAAQQIKNLYKLFDDCDCTMVEVGVNERHAHTETLLSVASSIWSATAAYDFQR